MVTVDKDKLREGDSWRARVYRAKDELFIRTRDTELALQESRSVDRPRQERMDRKIIERAMSIANDKMHAHQVEHGLEPLLHPLFIQLNLETQILDIDPDNAEAGERAMKFIRGIRKILVDTGFDFGQ